MSTLWDRLDALKAQYLEFFKAYQEFVLELSKDVEHAPDVSQSWLDKEPTKQFEPVLQFFFDCIKGAVEKERSLVKMGLSPSEAAAVIAKETENKPAYGPPLARDKGEHRQ